MPRLDGTGPSGEGPGTGRLLGRCLGQLAGSTQTRPTQGRLGGRGLAGAGLGRALGAGLCRGLSRCFGAGRGR